MAKQKPKAAPEMEDLPAWVKTFLAARFAGDKKAKEDPREFVILELSRDQAATLAGCLANSHAQMLHMLDPLLKDMPNRCAALAALDMILETVERAGEIARMLPASAPLELFSIVERDLYEKINRRAADNQHTHADEVEDLTKVH